MSKKHDINAESIGVSNASKAATHLLISFSMPTSYICKMFSRFSFQLTFMLSNDSGKELQTILNNFIEFLMSLINQFNSNVKWKKSYYLSIYQYRCSKYFSEGDEIKHVETCRDGYSHVFSIISQYSVTLHAHLLYTTCKRADN